MKDIIVVKLGGSVLRDVYTISRAADQVRKAVEDGLSIVVVVSALKGVTNSLIQLSMGLKPKVPDHILDEILSMGERTSAKVFAGALLARGLEPVVVDPEMDSWPIITNEKHLDADPLYEETKRGVREKILPLLIEGKVPVVCGFVGKSPSGRVTTLGRGGSDTTAVLLGSSLGAKEVVLVKDVKGVYSGDPAKVEGPVPLSFLNSEEAYILSSGGGSFLHPKALGYKDDKVRVRISSLEAALEELAEREPAHKNDEGAASLTGTVIEGGPVGIEVEAFSEPISMITIIQEPSSGTEAMVALVEEVKREGGRVASMVLDERATVLYASGGAGLVNSLHKFAVKRGLGKAVSFFEGLRMVTVKGRWMETSPGMVQRFTQPLAREGINIYGLSTISSSIRLFIAEEDVRRALSLLQSALRSEEGGYSSVKEAV